MTAEDRTGSLLPVLAYEPDRKLFFCADQTLAFGFLCQPLTGGDDKTESRLRVLLEEDWPTGTMMSFCLAASPNIKPFTYAVELIRFALYGQVNWEAAGVVAGCTAVFLAGAVFAYNPSKGLIARRGGPGGGG